MVAGVIYNVLESRFPKTNPDVQTLFKRFMTRCCSENYDERPDSDEFLKFFTVLNLFYREIKIEQNQKSYLNVYDRANEKYKHAAIMAMLATNQYKSDQDKAWKDYDYEDADTNKTIVLLVGNNFAVPSKDKYKNHFATIPTCASLITPALISHLFNNLKLNQACSEEDLINHILKDFPDTKTLIIALNQVLTKSAYQNIEINLNVLKEIKRKNKNGDELMSDAQCNHLIHSAVKHNLRIEMNRKTPIVNILMNLKQSLVNTGMIECGKLINLIKEVYQVNDVQLYHQIIDHVDLNAFKKAYLNNFSSRWFANPWSAMIMKLEEKGNAFSKADIKSHVARDEKSETTKVLMNML